MASAAFAKSTNPFSIPFELHNGLIIVKAMVNNEEKAFILDSGAPVILLNAHHFASQNQAGKAEGVSGSVELRKITLESFVWGSLKKANQSFIGADLNHLEKKIGLTIHGLIGYDTYKEFELLIDYDNRTLNLYKDHSHLNEPKDTISFTMQAHLPTISVEIDGTLLQTRFRHRSRTKPLRSNCYSKTI